ncbi:hypothetical protein AgCh_027607 [Apium graveolens]
MKFPTKNEECLKMELVDSVVTSELDQFLRKIDMPFESLGMEELNKAPKRLKPSIEEAPTLEIKPLPEHLRYAFLGDASTLPVIIVSDLSGSDEEKLPRILREFKSAIGRTIADIKEICPSYCMHKILLEEGSKPTVEQQRQLNPIMKEVVKKKILKWLDAGIIYPISDSSWNVEVFMDDFSVFGDSFDECLQNLGHILKSEPDDTASNSIANIRVTTQLKGTSNKSSCGKRIRGPSMKHILRDNLANRHKESMTVNNKVSRDVLKNNKTSDGENLIDSFNETDVSMHFEEEIIDETLNDGFTINIDLWEGYMISLGGPTSICQNCNAIMWKMEQNNKTCKHGKPTFSLCSMNGMVHIPFEKPSPEPLLSLLGNSPRSNHFKENICVYNSMFAMCSSGRKTDHLINNGGAPYCFKVRGQNLHLIVRDALRKGDHDPGFIGKVVVLPASFVGSQRCFYVQPLDPIGFDFDTQEQQWPEKRRCEPGNKSPATEITTNRKGKRGKMIERKKIEDEMKIRRITERERSKEIERVERCREIDVVE